MGAIAFVWRESATRIQQLAGEGIIRIKAVENNRTVLYYFDMLKLCVCVTQA